MLEPEQRQHYVILLVCLLGSLGCCIVAYAVPGDLGYVQWFVGRKYDQWVVWAPCDMCGQEPDLLDMHVMSWQSVLSRFI